MDLFTYLLAKNNKFSLVHKSDLFSYLLGKNNSSILPKEYKQIEYIEGTGTQYINTLYKPSNYTKYEIECSITDLNSTITGIIGSYSPTSSLMRWLIYLNSNNYFSVGYGNTYYATDIIPVLENKYTLIQTKSDFIINNEIYKSYTPPQEKVFSKDYALIFSRTTIETVYLTKMKLYKCKIYDDEEIVRNFIPCIRKEDNKPGLFDTINNEFYINNGTGEFLYG